MKSWFLKRSYPKHLPDTEMKKLSLSQEKKLKKVNWKWYHLQWLNICHLIVCTRSWEITLICFTWMKRWRIYSIQDPWFHLEVRVSEVAILWKLNYIHSIEKQNLKNTPKVVVRFVNMWLILTHLPVLRQENPLKLTISWTVMTDVSYIF